MKQSVNFYDFTKAFHDCGRGAQFTYEGLKALFEHLEEYEDDTGEEVELDVIALCCDWAEYLNLEAVRDAYREVDSLEDLFNNTNYICVSGGGFIIANY